MDKKTEALKLALEALEECRRDPRLKYEHPYYDKTITAIRKALAEQPAQQQKEGFASPGGGYVPAIPRPMPLDWKLVPRKATPEMLKAMDECAQEGYDERLYAGMASSVYMAAWDASPVMGTLPEQPAQQQEPVAVYVGETWCGSVVRLYEELPLETPLYTSPQPAQQQEPNK